MRALYISYDGMTDPLGQSQVIPYLVGLSAKGHRFTLVSFEKPQRFRENKDRIFALLSSHNIHWVPLMYTKRPPVFSTVWDIFKLFTKVKHLHKQQPFQLVHCRSYISSLVGLWMKKKYGTLFIFDMRGFWADERVDGGLWNLKNPLFKSIYSFFKKKEMAYIKHSDAIVSLTHAGKKEMLSWNIPSVHDKKITVIPCSADFDLFVAQTAAAKEIARSNLKINSDAVVMCYLGSLGTWYMLNEMLDFFSLILQNNSNAEFLIISGESPDMVAQLAHTKNIPAEKWKVVAAKRSEVPQLLQAADFGISFILPCYSKISSSPTKVGEMLAMGLPLICNAGVGDIERVLLETDGGTIVHEMSASSYTAAFSQIIELTKQSALARRENTRVHYSLEVAIEKYASIYTLLEKDAASTK